MIGWYKKNEFERDVEESGHDLIAGTTPEFVWRDEENH
jgi:hypothetical protein